MLLSIPQHDSDSQLFLICLPPPFLVSAGSNPAGSAGGSPAAPRQRQGQQSPRAGRRRCVCGSRADPPPGQNALETTRQRARRLSGLPKRRRGGRTRGSREEDRRRRRQGQLLVSRPHEPRAARAPGFLPSPRPAARSASPSRTGGRPSPGCWHVSPALAVLKLPDRSHRPHV